MSYFLIHNHYHWICFTITSSKNLKGQQLSLILLEMCLALCITVRLHTVRTKEWQQKHIHTFADTQHQHHSHWCLGFQPGSKDQQHGNDFRPDYISPGLLLPSLWWLHTHTVKQTQCKWVRSQWITHLGFILSLPFTLLQNSRFYSLFSF